MAVRSCGGQIGSDQGGVCTPPGGGGGSSGGRRPTPSGVRAVEAEFEPSQLQDLGDAVRLLDIKAKSNVSLRFHVRLEIGDGVTAVDPSIIADINKAYGIGGRQLPTGVARTSATNGPSCSLHFLGSTSPNLIASAQCAGHRPIPREEHRRRARILSYPRRLRGSLLSGHVDNPDSGSVLPLGPGSSSTTRSESSRPRKNAPRSSETARDRPHPGAREGLC